MQRRRSTVSLTALLVVAGGLPALALSPPHRVAAPWPLHAVAMRDFTLHFDHSLGAPEAKRRVADAIEQLRERFAGKVANVDVAWHGNDADVRVVALSQTANGHITLTDTTADLRVHLPALLSPFAEQATKVLNAQAFKALK